MSGWSVQGLRRYPVKSFGGEALLSATITEHGLDGDRRYAFVDESGAWASGKNGKRWRRHDEVFDYCAQTTDTGVRVTRGDVGWSVEDSALLDELKRRTGAELSLKRTQQAQTDSGRAAVSLIGSATLQWCAEHLRVNADPRRLRVNVVVKTDEPFVEETWLERDIQVGDAVVRVVKKIERCRMIDLAQDGAAADGRWLKPLMAQRDGFAAVGAQVVRPATVSLGDLVTLA